jgi:hypothetical protein
MVDFNNEATVTIPSLELVKILILQRRNDCFNAYEDFTKKLHQGLEVDLSITRARLFSWFLELQASLKRKLPPTEYAALIGKVNSNDKESIHDAILLMNEYCDNINLTKIDMRKIIDSSNVETENELKGL